MLLCFVVIYKKKLDFNNQIIGEYWKFHWEDCMTTNFIGNAEIDCLQISDRFFRWNILMLRQTNLATQPKEVFDR